ncbi:MAG: Holliday junction resolvase RuvX [Clostridia bacterium]|nr:Holliday junction resolvase RuvX [Clostridia bacterium]
MKILAVDLGLQRTGVAVCDELELLASPVGTVTQPDTELLCGEIAAIAAREGAREIVVGHPRNMDGSCGESAHRAEAFAEALRERSGLPVVLRDERLTTVSAHSVLNQTNVRGKKRKAVVDTVSATIILQDYLDSRR